MNRKKDLVKNIFVLAFGTILPRLSNFLALPIITAGLTKAEYGTYDLINTLISVLLPIATLQVQLAAFRFLIDYRNEKQKQNEIITNIVTFTTITSLAALLILFFCLYKLQLIERVLICFYFLADILLVTAQQVVRGFSHNKVYSTSAVIRSWLNLLLIIITIYYLKNGLTGVLISISVSTIMGLMFIMIKEKLWRHVNFSLISLDMLKQLINYSWPLVPNSLSNWVLNLSDRLVLTAFIGIETTAVYAVANKIPALFTVIQTTFVFAWQENATISLNDGDMTSYYTEMYDEIFNILVGGMALLIAGTPFLFKVLIRGDYEEAYVHMPILLMALFFSAIASYMSGIYVAHKRTKSIGISTIAAALINLIIDVSMIKRFGIFAASISTLISYIVLAVYRMTDVQRFQKVKYNYKKIFLYTILLMALCILTWINSETSIIFNILSSVVIAFISSKKNIYVVFKLLGWKKFNK